ncbi:MAG: PfkB family carbohydrate kinase [Verrucomicrobiales bacterium]|nr:PfkB family carbohydrate kinase [Verrucomicrobiales bacterium]
MSNKDIESLIESFSKLRIVVIGDVMLDRFIWGNVTRISPEAPVPVVEVSRESVYPGGAANVARNITPFGAKAELIGLIGADSEGEVLADTLEKNHIGIDHMLVEKSFSTITKTRVVAQHQQVVRIDREKKQALSDSARSLILNQLRAVISEVDGIIIEDYGKGLIDDALVREVVEIATAGDVLVTVDPNPKNCIDWKGVCTVKPNRSEAFHEAGMQDFGGHLPPLEDVDLLKVGSVLLKRWHSQYVLITLGEQGMILFCDGGAPYHIPTRAREVFDVSGAGDTAIAVFTMALCAGANALTAADLSNRASGVVVGKLGTAEITKDDLLKAVAE